MTNIRSDASRNNKYDGGSTISFKSGTWEEKSKFEFTPQPNININSEYKIQCTNQQSVSG
jgi:hypothetical protein